MFGSSRSLAVLAALSVLTGAGLVLATPAGATPIVDGTGTFLTVSGRGGDPITHDQRSHLTPANATFLATATPFGTSPAGGAVRISVSKPDGTGFSLELAASGTEPLQPGLYRGAVRFPFQESTPGLSLGTGTTACNEVTGSFRVREARFGRNGWIESFDATFRQHCEGDPESVAFGHVVLHNVPAPEPLVATVVLDEQQPLSTSTGTVTIGGTVTCNQRTTVRFSGTVTQTGTEDWNSPRANFDTDDVTCSSEPTRWSSRAFVYVQGFHPGPAPVRGYYVGYDQVSEEQPLEQFSGDVELVAVP